MSESLLGILNDINTSLALLAQQIRAEALAGFGSGNKVAEHVLLPVLRCVYAAPGLINTNALAANFPGIDLYDPSSGLGVQITSDDTAGKITDTINTILSNSVPLQRLVVVIVRHDTPEFSGPTREKWARTAGGYFKFNPKADIFAFDRLLHRIQNLDSTDIYAIAAELGALVRGVHAFHLLPHLRRQVESQLAEERRIARYIPDVFVETQDTKYQGRCFAHPVLFIKRIADWFDREPLSGLNRIAAMSGVPPLSAPPIEKAANKLDEVIAVAESAILGLQRFETELFTYSEICRDEGAHIPRDSARAYVLEETHYYIEMGARSLKYKTNDRLTELRCVASKFFLLTGPAGQGKTNFLCDFAERFLLRHEIPSAYITARNLSRIPAPDLTEVLCRLIFPPAVLSLDEGLRALKAECEGRALPFVLVIDGLNEHPDIRTFAGQLEHMLEVLSKYPYVRVLMTCRSEFLEQRFGSLLSGPLAPYLHVSKAHGQRFDDAQFQELVARYFRFFKVRPSRVFSSVVSFLQRDVLMLRFFCEAYGARGRDGAYVQPYVAGIYRDEIFRSYIEDKLGRAQRALLFDRSATQPLARQTGLRRVLSLVAAHMLETGCFTDVPRDVVPAELDRELTALLDEELVLRHDLGPASSMLSEPSEVLNFTFDEMRDFLLAQHLLNVHSKDPGEFSRLLSAQQPGAAQTVEGIQRFLFYASRVPNNLVFFTEYRSHPWYGAVYDSEVFAIPPTHVNNDDEIIIENAMSLGGAGAISFVRKLAVRWKVSAFPILNLDFLIEVTHRLGGDFFGNVIVPAFGHSSYGDESLCRNFCSFVEAHVLKNLKPYGEHPYEPVFRLLFVLLPIHASPALESPAAGALRSLAAEFPRQLLRVLPRVINEVGPRHRLFLWHVLATSEFSALDLVDFKAYAQDDVDNEGVDVALRREAEWFIDRLSRNGV